MQTRKSDADADTKADTDDQQDLHQKQYVPLPLDVGTYGKCPKNSNTKVSDKMTYVNSADPDQTAPEGAV